MFKKVKRSKEDIIGKRRREIDGDERDDLGVGSEVKVEKNQHEAKRKNFGVSASVLLAKAHAEEDEGVVKEEIKIDAHKLVGLLTEGGRG